MTRTIAATESALVLDDRDGIIVVAANDRHRRILNVLAEMLSDPAFWMELEAESVRVP